MLLRCPCQNMRMETIKQDLKYPSLAMAAHIHSVMTTIVTENYRVIRAVLSVCICNIYKIWMKANSFPEAFCQTPSTEAVNISCQPEQPFTSLRTEPCYSCVLFQAEPILESWIRPDHIIYSSPVYGNSAWHPFKQQNQYLTREFRHLGMEEHWFLLNRPLSPSNLAWQL